MAKRWRIHSHDPSRVAQLERAAGIPAVVAQLLLARGLSDPEIVREFLAAKLSGLRDPELLPGAVEAARRLAVAVAEKRRICIYGDYDADGMTATSILLLALQMLGGNVTYYVPSRIDEGYGLNCEALRTLAASGVQTVITVDCGIASVAEAETAREVGLELIITDHHEFGESLPAADVLVHPRLPGTNYPFAGLAGAGVAFKVAWALCQEVAGAKRVGERMKQYLLQALSLAAIGTVADVVPLIDENRILVTHGLNSLLEFPTLGLAELMRVTKLNEKNRLTSEDIAFTLGPRLNAAGRLGQAQLAIELMTTDSTERAVALAEYIHQLNDSRTSLERSIYLAANKQATEQFDPVGDAALVLAERGWHPGVIGIVAGRLAEKFNRPVVLIAQDEVGVKPGVGSARSIPNFSLHAALAACGQHLLGHGGHAAAAGLKIEDARIEAFRQDFVEYAAGEIPSADLVAELFIDAETSLGLLTPQSVGQIEKMAPFGQGNRRPMLCTTGVRLVDPPQRMGAGGRHLSMKLEQHGVQLRAVAFGKGDWADEMAEITEPVSLAFQPVINSFRGRHSVELHVSDWQVCEPAESAASPAMPEN
jgi:single-stranded-DNA-specific exonuclease